MLEDVVKTFKIKEKCWEERRKVEDVMSVSRKCEKVNKGFNNGTTNDGEKTGERYSKQKTMESSKNKDEKRRTWSTHPQNVFEKYVK